MKVSLIIPTLNRREILLETLKHLTRESGDFEVLVVDQSDHPVSQIEVRYIDPRIKVIHEKVKNLPRARNIGAQKALGQVLIFVDDDVEPRVNNFVATHMQNYENASIHMVAGRVLQPHERESRPASRPGRLRAPWFIVGGSFNVEKRQSAEMVIGCNFSVRRKTFLELGGFDENFVGTANLEESEFAYRLGTAGYHIIFDPEAFVKHSALPTGGVRNNAKKKAEQRYWLVKNYMYFLKKHGTWYLWPVYLSILVLRGVYYGFKDWSFASYTAMCRAIWHALTKKSA